MEIIVTRDHEFKRDKIKNHLVELANKYKNIPGAMFGAGLVATMVSEAAPVTFVTKGGLLFISGNGFTPIGAAIYAVPFAIASWKAISSAKRLTELVLTNTITTALYKDVDHVPTRLWDVSNNKVVYTNSIWFASYHAISHTWHKHDKSIRLPGMNWDAIGISDEELENTRIFLTKCNVKYAWIDNLCINQTDEVERGHELKKMGAFYANCKSTIIFPHGLGCFKPIVDESGVGPWFNRVWTLQELMASHNPKFVVYHSENILLGANCIRNILTDAITSLMDINTKNMCLGALEDLTIHGTVGMTIVDAVYQSFCRNVTKEEDRVYGILGFMGSRSDAIEVKIGEGLDYAIGELRKVLTPEEHVNMAVLTTSKISVSTMTKRYKTLAMLEELYVSNLRIDGDTMHCIAYVTRLSDSYHISEIGSKITFAEEDIANISVRLMKTTKYSHKPGRITAGKWCSCGKCIKKHSNTSTNFTSAINFVQYARTDNSFDSMWLIALFTTKMSFLENIHTCLVCSLDSGIYNKIGVAYVDKRIGNWGREEICVKNIW